MHNGVKAMNKMDKNYYLDNSEDIDNYDYLYPSDDEFQEFRSNMLNEMQTRETTLINNFMKSIGYNKPVAYYRDISNAELTIYTTNPGMIIGKRGVNVDKLKAILSSEFGGDKWKVNFVEIRGGFANTERDINDVIDNMISVVKEWKKVTDTVSCDTIMDMLDFNRKKD